MGERMGRIGRIRTDFSLVLVLEIREKIKKSVWIRPIRPIRSPIGSQPIATFRNPQSTFRNSEIPCHKLAILK
jgi:hypothetical protein